MKKLTYPGHVDEQGRLQIDRQLFASAVKQFSGSEITLTIEKRSKRRSNPQNAYLWAVVYPCVLEGLIGVGYDLDKTVTGKRFRPVPKSNFWNKNNTLS